MRLAGTSAPSPPQRGQELYGHHAILTPGKGGSRDFSGDVRASSPTQKAFGGGGTNHGLALLGWRWPLLHIRFWHLGQRSPRQHESPTTTHQTNEGMANPGVTRVTGCARADRQVQFPDPLVLQRRVAGGGGTGLGEREREREREVRKLEKTKFTVLVGALPPTGALPSVVLPG